MVDILQAKFSDAFFWLKTFVCWFVCWFKFYWRLFPRTNMTVSIRSNKKTLPINQCCPIPICSTHRINGSFLQNFWIIISWRRHQMETFSTLVALCEGNTSVTGGFPSQRPVTHRFDVFFDLRLNKWLSKQSRRWWSETPSRSVWRHSNVSIAVILAWAAKSFFFVLFSFPIRWLVCL